MKKQLFGKLPDGREVFLYKIKNKEASLWVMNFGARIVRFIPYGIDIVAGFDDFTHYLKDDSSHGAIVGRVANRIADAELNIDGAIHMLSANQNGNCLHGGNEGFSQKFWDVESMNVNSITFSYYSPDGDEGFPGGLSAKVTYTLEGSTLIIKYEAIPEEKTAIALTNHAYFNLNGLGDTVLKTVARIFADTYSETDAKNIPTGNRPSVKGTVYDFSYEKAFGEDISENFDGHDINYNLNPLIYRRYFGKILGLGAVVTGENLRMYYYTDQPCCQLYLGNHLGKKADEPSFHDGKPQIKNGTFCLESQTEPNCVNRGKAIYSAGEIYTQTTVYEIKKL